MGMQEYLIKLDYNNKDSVIAVFGEKQLQCITKIKKDIKNIETLQAKKVCLKKGDICAVLYGDQYMIHQILLTVFSKYDSFISEKVNEAATGIIFPSREQIQEYFQDISVTRYTTETLLEKMKTSAENETYCENPDNILKEHMLVNISENNMESTRFQDILQTWIRAKEKFIVEEMFYLFTNMNFLDYLKLCQGNHL